MYMRKQNLEAHSGRFTEFHSRNSRNNHTRSPVSLRRSSVIFVWHAAQGKKTHNGDAQLVAFQIVRPFQRFLGVNGMSHVLLGCLGGDDVKVPQDLGSPCVWG